MTMMTKSAMGSTKLACVHLYNYVHIPEYKHQFCMSLCMSLSTPRSYMITNTMLEYSKHKKKL